ncbi:MAG: amino acid ABC transporter permease [Vulcanimicrobiaceae bacterium]
MHVIIDNWAYLARAAVNTLWISVVCIAISTVFGAFFGVAAAYHIRVLDQINRACVWVVRGVPLLVVLFAGYFSMPPSVSPYVTAVATLSAYFTFFISEVVRGTVAAVPRGQLEAAKSVGLSFWKRVWLVVLPQALRTALPPVINVWVVLVKGTAYASVISVWELTTASSEVAQRTVEPFQVYGFTILIYFIICFPMTQLGRIAEARFHFKH